VDISPLPTPPPTPPPSEIPSVIPEQVAPLVQPPVIPMPTPMTNGHGEKKNIVVTSTPLAKQLLSQQKSGIPTPMRPSASATPAAPAATPSRCRCYKNLLSSSSSFTHRQIKLECFVLQTVSAKSDICSKALKYNIQPCLIFESPCCSRLHG
jgi:hypothetical protein